MHTAPIRLAPVGRFVAAKIARRHHLSASTVEHMMEALAAGDPVPAHDDDAVSAEVAAALAADRGWLLWPDDGPRQAM